MVDSSAIGRSFAPTHARVEPGRLHYFLNTLGETNPVFRDPAVAEAAGFAAPPIPPTYLFCLEMMDAGNSFEMFEELGVDIGRVLHGEQKCLVAVWSGSRAANPCRMAGLAPSRMFLGSAEKGRFFVPA